MLFLSCFQDFCVYRVGLGFPPCYEVYLNWVKRWETSFFLYFAYDLGFAPSAFGEIFGYDQDVYVACCCRVSCDDAAEGHDFSFT